MFIVRFFSCVVVLVSLLPSLGRAHYVHFETPDAHILVARPMERWSVNKDARFMPVHTHFDGMRIITLDGHFRRGEDGKELDRIAFVKGKDRITEALRANLASRKLKPANGSSYTSYSLKAPVRLSPDSIVHFQEAKAKNYVAWSSVQSPGVGERNASISNAVTGVVELGVGVVATFLTGSELTGFFSGALGGVKKAGNLAFDAGRQWGLPHGYSVPALPVTGFDFGPYKQIDYRAISMESGAGALHGEIYIAYKNEKTPEAEDAALIVALTEALAINSTKEQVQAAQRKEFELRAKIWADCLASGACKE